MNTVPLRQVGDIQLNYTVQGEGDWLVLIGGYASGNWQAWGGHLTELAKRYRVLAFDNRGIGESDAPDHPYTTRMMAQDTLGLMDALGIDRAHILGKSLGGAIAQHVALERPERVRSLAMTSTFAVMDARAKRMVEWWRRTAQEAGFAALFPGLLTYFFTAEFYTANLAAIARMERTLIEAKRPLHGFLNTGNCLLTHDVTDRLAEITAPTLIMCGDEDIITPPRHAEEMGRRIPKAEVRIIPRTLHGFLTERPDSFDVILDFLARH
jgi:pimeloyl-ACP methyl ester carboxylesterase